MSFADHNLSFVVAVVVVSIVIVVVNFQHFHLLLQNNWTNFNQTWLKLSLGEGDSSLFKGDFPTGDNDEMAKIH